MGQGWLRFSFVPWMNAAIVVRSKGVLVQIETEFIKLDSFLKAVNVVGSGGESKIIIAEGLVTVNGQVEQRRGRKLYPGDRVELQGESFLVERAGA